MSEQAMGPALEPDEFERVLTQAMRRVDAPEGFAERVMGLAAEGSAGGSARVRESGPGAPDGVAETAGSRGRVMVMRSRFASLSQRAWIGGAIAAVLVLGVFGGEQMHQRREREQAALAQQQFDVAVRVTDQAIAQTRAQLERAGLRLDD